MSDQIAVVPPVAETAPAAPVNVLSTLTREQRAKWQMTGEIPETKPVESETSSAAKAESLETAVAAESDVPVESDKAAKGAKPHKPREDTNARFGQLSEKARLATERAEAAERKAAALEAKLNGTSVPPPVTTETPAPPKPPTYVDLVKRYESEATWPKLDEFVAAGLADPYAAMLAAQAAFIGERQFAERQQAQRIEAGRTRVQENITKAFARAREIGDFDEAALNFEAPSTFIETIMESSLSGELLNHFSKHPTEVRALAAMEPFAAARAVGKLEAQLSAPPASRTATKTTSDAPPPPLTLGSRHTPGATDEAEDAIASQDFRRYRATMNKRELAATR